MGSIQYRGKNYKFQQNNSGTTVWFDIEVSSRLANEVFIVYDKVECVQGLQGYFERKELKV